MPAFTRSRLVGAVEIGTSKITVLVGEVAGASLQVVGLGEFPSRGVIKGVITDVPAAGEATHRALVAAEHSAGARIDQVFLAQTGAHIDGFYHEAAVNVGGLEGRVRQLDMDNVTSLAKNKALPPERCIVHYLRRPYELDGARVASPEELRGTRLSLGMWHVHGSQARIADGVHIIRNFSLPLSELVLSGLAAGHLVTTAEERHHGALVLDIGAGVTDYTYYRDGVPHAAGVLAVGGNHLTNDLALGLRITEGQAEKMKLHHGRAAVTAKDRLEHVWLNGDMGIGDRRFPRMTIEQITAARIRELLEVVRKKLGNAYSPEATPAGVVLTGGTSLLPGIEEAAARVFETQARLGTPSIQVADKLRHPGYATALGLLYQGLSHHLEHSTTRPPGLFGRMRRALDNLARL